MLVGHRRRAPDRAGRVGARERDTALPPPPVRRMLDVHDHATVIDLRIGDHLGDLIDLPDADVGFHEDLVPLVTIAGLDERLDLAPRRLLLGARRAHALVGAPAESLEVAPSDRAAEMLPEPRVRTP